MIQNWSTQRWVLTGLLVIAAGVASYNQIQPIESSSAMKVAKIRNSLTAATVPRVEGLAYFGTDNMPAPTGEERIPADINEMLRDFPTAAGAIQDRVMLEQQYQAAMGGDRDQAMKMMAESFKKGQGSGSYKQD
ncbi:hypothetical protein [Ferrimonas marina]|uniref:Uncharacterized protein n=1 Tax=Ferrimonas marina TaxID=299255 RepID=A0A1M5Z6C6_9GAMM|nr:hypothetical protein [Ferrimonas marina]SHI19802.1 hypothetical protein SAMN02745129_4746 [Ferrimonas marina]